MFNRFLLILCLLVLMLGTTPVVHPQAALRCTQALADPAVALAAADSPWTEVFPTRQLSTAQSRSAPQSLALVGAPASGAATGQVFSVPANTADLYGTLFVRFSLNNHPASAALRLTLYAGASLEATDQLLSTSLTYASGNANSWRQFDWELTDPVALERLQTAGLATLVLDLVDINTGLVWLDDLHANVCVPSASLSGHVRLSDAAADLSGATVLLAHTTATGTQVIASTQSDAAGNYQFSGMQALQADEFYQIWYHNQPGESQRPLGRIGWLAGPVISSLGDGDALSGLDLVLDDLRLDVPEPNATVVLNATTPVTLRWSGRNLSGERQQACVYDPQRIDPRTGAPPELCGPLRNPMRDPLSFTLTPASFAAVPELAFTYGRRYHWYVRVVAATQPAGQPPQRGQSFFEQAISFQPSASTPLSPPPLSTDPGLPRANSNPAEWTLLIYAAADNELSDGQRRSGPDRVDYWLSELDELAAQHPNVQIVSLLDRFGSTGIEQCAWRGTSRDCQMRPEQNSATPATLREFVRQGLQRYPAQRAALLMIGPGHALGGFGSDATTPETGPLSPAALAEALRSATNSTERRLDLVIAQAPLFGELDLAASLAPAADYFVAAPDQIWQINLLPQIVPYLSDLNRNRPLEVALALPTIYADQVTQRLPERGFALLAMDLRQAAAALDAREALANALITALRSDAATTRSQLDAARRAAQPYDASANGRLRALLAPNGAEQNADEDAFVDSADLAMQLAAAPLLPAAVRSAATAFSEQITAETGLIIASSAQSGAGIAGDTVDLSRVGGPALFLPSAAALGNQPTLSLLWLERPPTASTAWAALLRELQRSSLPGNGPAGILVDRLATPGIALPSGGGTGATAVYLPIIQR
jgi:hypothetical protein